MKIGIDARLWSQTGVGRYIRNLVLELVKIDKKNSYVLFARKNDKENIKDQASSIKEWKIVNEKWKIVQVDIRWHTLSEQILFPSILNKENLDLIHFPYFSVPVFYTKPYLVTIHDLILHHYPTGEASTLPLPLYWAKMLSYRFVISQAVKNAKKILAVSNATKQELLDHFSVKAEKIVVIYEGAGVTELRIKNSELRTQNYFLYVGNAYPHKNLIRMLQAFVNLKSQIPASPTGGSNLKCILVGKEDYFYKRLKEKVQTMGLENSVMFYSEVTDTKLGELYRNAKALIIPSLMEGFGLPAIEAMSLGCLVLASDILVHREICADAAIYFNPTSIEDIAKKMSLIHYNDTYHYSDKIKAGFKRAKMFSWKKMAEETLKVYESCFSLR